MRRRLRVVPPVPERCSAHLVRWKSPTTGRTSYPGITSGLHEASAAAPGAADTTASASPRAEN